MELGKRMKEYEYSTRTYLTRRLPLIIRLDGKAFHTFTRGFEKPFDDILNKTMQDTLKYLCENVQGCVFGYTESDEISLLVIDNQTKDSCAWFDKNLSKILSISSSMATFIFNRRFNFYVNIYSDSIGFNPKILEAYYKALDKGALFDSRAFILPEEEVCNYFIWRQQDASRNSIQMLAQILFSHKELQNKNSSELQEMMFSKHGVNWNNLETKWKRGVACFKTIKCISTPEGDAIRQRMVLDENIPLFTSDREFIDKWLRG